MSYSTIGKWRAQCACKRVAHVCTLAWIGAGFVVGAAAAAGLDALALGGAAILVFALGGGAIADYIERRLERM